MKNKFILLVLFFVLVSVLPTQTSAFWWFGQKKAETKIAKTEPQGLSDQEKIKATAKYKIWNDAFEKKNIETVISNQDKFIFTVSELNYLLETESKKVKKPSLAGASITSSNGNINVATTFNKFIKGRFSFVAKAISVDNKIRLQLSYVKLYGVSVPTKWLEGPLNKELDDYFSFLYKDARYQEVSINVSDELLQLKPEFKK